MFQELKIIMINWDVLSRLCVMFKICLPGVLLNMSSRRSALVCVVCSAGVGLVMGMFILRFSLGFACLLAEIFIVSGMSLLVYSLLRQRALLGVASIIVMSASVLTFPIYLLNQNVLLPILSTITFTLSLAIISIVVCVHRRKLRRL